MTDARDGSAGHPRAALRNIRVRALETIPLRVPFRDPQYKIAVGGHRSHQEILIVRLLTDDGGSGIGETMAWRRQGSVETIASLRAAIHDLLSPCVIGRSPFDIAAIMRDMDRALDKSLYAKAPICDALYDLQGKMLSVPLYELFGGKVRDRIGVCAVLTIKDDWRETLAGAEQSYDRGFRSFAIKVGPDSPKTDLRNIRGIRERFPDAIIRIDANASMTFDNALWLLARIQDYDIDAAEQLLAMWDVDGLAELARRFSIPIMVDETIATEHDLLHVIQRRAASVFQTKIAKNGGIWGCRKLWTIGAAAGMRIYPGNHPCTSVSTAAVMHMIAAWPGEILEGPFAAGITDALERDIVQVPVAVQGRFIHVPEGPGLGLTLDDSAVESMRLAD